MKTLLAWLIVISLTANVWLALRFDSNGVGGKATAGNLPAGGAVAPKPADAGTAVIAVGNLSAAALEMTDLLALRDQMRAEGADDTMIRSAMEGMLRRRYREKLAARDIDRMRDAWWRSAPSTPGADDERLLNQIVRNPLRELLGSDPLELADAEKRFSFLPPEKRRLLAQIALDYAELEAGVGGASPMDRLQSDIAQRRLLAEERRKDVLAALTPEERAEYDLRFGFPAGILSGRLATMNGSEQEFRALKPLLEEFERQSTALPKGDGFSTAYSGLQQKTMDQIVAAIGFDRALDYLWSGNGVYAGLARATQEMNLPVGTAARVLQLAADTGERAAAIHRDPAIPVEQKRAALLALQEAVRPAFDELLPEGVRAKVPEPAVTWFGTLGDGRYMGYLPNFTGTGFGTIAPISVTSPAGSGFPSIPRPRPLSR